MWVSAKVETSVQFEVMTAKELAAVLLLSFPLESLEELEKVAGEMLLRMAPVMWSSLGLCFRMGPIPTRVPLVG